MPVWNHRRVPSFKVPNRLILDGGLTFSARRMGAVLFSRRNALGSCRKSLAALAKLAMCSVATARKALEELEANGYLVRCRHYKYDEKQGRLVYDQYTYHCDLGFQGGFTLIPRDLFGHPLKSSAFVLCLYLYLQAGNSKRAFPSLNEICRRLDMGKATVCRGLKSLGAAGRVYVQRCLKMNRAYSRNSYFFPHHSPRPVSAITAQGGSGILRSTLIQCSASRAPLRRHRPSRAGTGFPPPCYHYTPAQENAQGLDSHRGSLKISKLVLRLR